MARVIAEAKDNPELWKMQSTCTGKGWNDPHHRPCYRLIEIDATDIYKRAYTDLGGGVETYYGFICPVCGTFTELNDKFIPDYIKSKARDYEDRPQTGLDFNKM